MDLTRLREADRLIEAGHPLEDAGECEAALECYRKAIAAAPAYARAHMNAGNALRKLKRWDEAIGAQQAAVECAPDYAPARFNLGALLLARDRLREAERELLQASRLQPEMAEAAVLLADLYEKVERLDDAEAQFRRALALTPGHAGTIVNFGTFCLRQGRRDEAVALLTRAHELEPSIENLDSLLLFSLNFATDLSAEAIADKHRQIGADITRRAGPPLRTWSNDADPGRVLRVGYVSGDFFNHPVALFLRPVLERHDPRAVETFCYSNYGHDNEVARVLRQCSRHWRDISALTDEQLIAQLRDDRIDVLVDLSGHTDRNRLSAFARHPAPVQVTWLGYLNTTGLPAMDFRICDRHTDPEGVTEHLHTESLVRMPDSQWCYEPWPGIERIPVAQPEPRDSIRFGSFNQVAKIGDRCLELWCDVLSRVSGSSLLVLDVRQAQTRSALLRRIERNGIDPARVSTRGRMSMVDYFAAIGSVDIALDTYPYNGATTTFDTLWMGVPIVGLTGERGISRGTYSILRSVGLEELIAPSAETYADLNVRLAADAAWRTDLRATLRPRLAASPLMDPRTFTRALEERYRVMWRAWCGKSIEGRSVNA